MVTIFYKWLLGDEVVTEDVEEELLDESDRVCYISNLPLLRELTEALPPEPTEEEIPQIVEGGS
jgi:hypothetical protein